MAGGVFGPDHLPPQGPDRPPALVPAEEAQLLCHDFEVEEAPTAFGVSRVYIDDIAKVWAIRSVITRSLEITRKLKDTETTKTEPQT